MLVWSIKIISHLKSQSKFQMFTLLPGRHIGVPTWRLHTGFCKFVQNYSTNIWSLGNRTWSSGKSTRLLNFIHWMVFQLFLYNVTVQAKNFHLLYVVVKHIQYCIFRKSNRTQIQGSCRSGNNHDYTEKCRHEVVAHYLDLTWRNSACRNPPISEISISLFPRSRIVLAG